MFYQLHIQSCQPSEVEALNDALLGGGALSVTLTDEFDDPVLEPAPGETPLWPHVNLTGLFDDEHLAQQTQAILSATHPALTYTLTPLEEQVWERAWMNDFKPLCFAKRFWIYPSWSEDVDLSAPHLILDPGLAFGTGTHPTTALCLTWLARQSLDQQRLIDYGCGSGILALAALKLGATHVEAVDIDEQALIATKANALSNNITPSQLMTGHPDALSSKADILIANILLEPLLALKHRFHEHLNEHGRLVVSGLLSNQVDCLTNAYEPYFERSMLTTQDEWALCEFKPRCCAV